jgi:hypothetical protein
MSTDSALRPLPHLLPPAPPPMVMGRVAAATSSRPAAQLLVLPAAAQLLIGRTAKSLGIVGTRRRRLLFATLVCLFGIIVSTEIAYANEMWVSRTIAGVPQHFILTSLVLAVAFAVDSKYLLQLPTRPAVVFYLVCLLMVVAVGFVRNWGNRYLVFADLYLIRWFFVGFIMMRLAIVSGYLRPYLIATAIVVLFTALQIDTRNTMGGQVDTTMVRASSVDFWPVINLATVMLGLLVTVNWPRGILYVAFGSSAFGLAVLLGGVRSSTRSLFVTQTLCFLLCLLALSRDPRMRGRGGELRKVGLLLLLLSAPVLAYMVGTGQLLGGVSQLGNRFSVETRERYDTGAARVAEAADMLENLAPEEWLFGMGVGGMFFNTMGYWTSVPHISVLGWLQKGGLFIFFVVLWAAYITPVASFFKAVTLPRRNTPLSSPILIVGPPLLAWGSLTFISGGLDNGSFLGLGGLAALWMQLADDDRRFMAAKPALVTASR